MSIDASEGGPVFLQSPQIGFQQPEYSLGFPRAEAGGLNTNFGFRADPARHYLA
jgi:hypothetical protein